jgi:hypothetical protein
MYGDEKKFCRGSSPLCGMREYRERPDFPEDADEHGQKV